jgi:asparagine synthase (glutamine-hydrolysing)
MCGILGVAGKTISDEDFRTHLEHLTKRGPDSQKMMHVSSECIMGATRLAMVDPLPRSNQPMIDKETGDVLTFNGEIYNYIELRKDFEIKGL